MRQLWYLAQTEATQRVVEQVVSDEWINFAELNVWSGHNPGANLIFLLRSLFGVNARAEIFAWLLVHGSGNPTAIARDTGYFFKSVQLTLNELEESCQIISSRQGREKIYRIVADSWHFLLAPHGHAKDERIFPVWLDWMPVFAILSPGLRSHGLSGHLPGPTGQKTPAHG